MPGSVQAITGPFPFQAAEEAFHRGVVPAAALAVWICTEIWVKNSISLHRKLTPLQRRNRLAALLGAVLNWVNSKMQKHGQIWMQINRLAFEQFEQSPEGRPFDSSADGVARENAQRAKRASGPL